MEDITITQDQLFDAIKRTMSFSKEYAIEKLDTDGNFIVFINGDFTNFFILRKSIVDYIATKSSVYANLQDSYNKFVESAKERAKELINREDEIKSLKEELKVLREEKKCKAYVVAKANYDELYKNHEDLISDHNKVIDEYKGLQTNYTDLKHEYEEILKEHDSYKNDIELLRTANKNLRADNENYYGIKSQYDQLIVSYNQLESNYKYVLSRNEELNSIVKHNNTEITVLRDTVEQLCAKIKTQDAIIEINKEKIEKQDKEIQSYKNINKQSKSDL